MPHVITDSCCNDASCVDVCPVNCIHPAPGEPGFGTAEMLFISPDACIDCGSCVVECPVGAIVPDDELTPEQEPFLTLNADFFDHGDWTDPGPGIPDERSPSPNGPLHVAIVGSGPAAFYAAQELLVHPNVAVDMFERLPTPYGLVRAGVAPDHQRTKEIEEVFAKIAAKPNFSYFLNVEVSEHITTHELSERYHAVIYAVGASAGRRLTIAGNDLANVFSATEFVGWYNGHPDHAALNVDLSCERAVVIGNGNVALDVARILALDPDELARTDIADRALSQLRDSKISEVIVLARRGVAQAAYTVGELLALAQLEHVSLEIDPAELTVDETTEAALRAGTLGFTAATKLRLAQDIADSSATERRRITFRFLVTPTEITGSTSVTGVACTRNEFLGDAVTPTDRRVEFDAGLVVQAVGYESGPVIGLPFDEERAVIPNVGGRVLTAPAGDVMPGTYVAGWIKRGATGGIGANRRCGRETARAVLDDHAAETLPAPVTGRDDVATLVERRGARLVDDTGWRRIDLAERSAGAELGRRRLKLTTVSDLESASAAS